MRLRAGTPQVGRAGRRGGVLIPLVVIVSVLALLAGAGLSFNEAVKTEVLGARDLRRALYLAEAGVAEVLAALDATLETQAPPPASLGSDAEPRPRRSGGYWVEVADNGDGTFTVTSTGAVNDGQRRVQAVVRREGRGAFDRALFAGNASGDPTYTLTLGGTADEADRIDGDVFSGGDLALGGDARVTGSLGAAGIVRGASGEEGARVPVPDVAGMRYEVNHDYDVAALFEASGEWLESGAGGRAWQLPASSPAHVFRKDPDDRAAGNASTAKDDYYLEDPYEPLGDDAFGISLSAEAADHKVFFIDGNLWIHNHRTDAFRLRSAGEDGTQVTLVVRGNVYVADDLTYEDRERDGLALIAIADETLEDSGNIYFGDPEPGTLAHVSALMYAENDLFDFQPDAAGSAAVRVYGNLAAGDHLSIHRDHGGQHSPLTVELDDRLGRGRLALPGLPSAPGAGGRYAVVAWREVPLP